jgi:hypothetical protein
MNILSFDDTNSNKIKRDSNQNDLFDLFQKNIINIDNILLQIYIVPQEFEMRLDRISNFIYGSPNYVEELMVLNDIINPYSVKEGQYIYFCQVDNLPKLYTTDNLQNLTSTTARNNLINSSKSNTKISTDLNVSDENLSPTIKPSNLKQIKVGSDNNIQIINSFQ